MMKVEIKIIGTGLIAPATFMTEEVRIVVVGVVALAAPRR